MSSVNILYIEKIQKSQKFVDNTTINTVIMI